MRYLLPDQPYEIPLAAGTLHYDPPAGVVEHWRLSSALDGYRFFRLDLDRRPAGGGSLLAHLLLDEQGRVENLRWRAFGPGLRARGKVLVEEAAVTVIREVNGRHVEDERAAASAPIFLPTAAGCTLLRPWAGRGPQTGLTFDLSPADLERSESGFASLDVICTCALRTVGEGRRELTVSWRPPAGGAEETVVLALEDPHAVVTAARWDSGLQAAAGQTVRYRRSGRRGDASA